MNKMLIPIGLALGMVGGTAWAVATVEPPPAVHADSLATDSLAPDSLAAADSTSHDDGHGTPRVGPAPVATPGPVVPTTVPARRAGEADDGNAAEEDGAEQLARIFAVMQPRDAARVLAHLKNVEIQAILTRMGARQAAAVLSNMEPDRAAVLSRAVLDGVAP